MITISWDVQKVFAYAQQNNTIDYYSLDELNSLLYKDITSSIDEFQRIATKIVYQHKNQINPLLVMYFAPMGLYIFLDGRHRFIEFMKYKQNQLIPVYTVRDDECSKFILHANEYVIYAILHNLHCMNGCFSNERINLPLINPDPFDHS